ncbi:GntR family transcriptional regulator [Paenibacillus rhizovicinus]|uniref:GntR family transcriptional regulator n=1 Tax=Paenibacillus rhizovicinus TaxID=2704463 RepID=A0A6C0NYY6_9BACL|nr:GntR family transcriptional regulator [Paenibacillus rhizovicinus]QHW31331.1 GntR family transcriptional regulator [Paenibacillus rhizovicinus]
MSAPSLRDQAYHIIYEQIAAGALAGGTVTSEVQLSAQLDMSRTPVRAALQQLETEGFVRIISKHGVLVLDASAQRTGDLLELIAAILLFAVASVRRLDPEGLAELSLKLAAELQVRLEADKLDANPEALCAFELSAIRSILALGRNQEMQETAERSASRLFWLSSGRRWTAPCRDEMADVMQLLLHRLPASNDAFHDAMQRYLRMLKMNW